MSDKRLHMPAELVQLTLNWVYLGQRCANVLYAVSLDDAGTPIPMSTANAVALATELGSQYLENYFPLTAKDASLESIGYVFESAGPGGPLEGGLYIATDMPYIGEEAHDGCPSNVTLAIRLDTEFLGRSNHGRFYFVGINSGLYDIDNPNVVKPGSLVDFDGANAAFQTAMEAVTLTSPAATGSLVVASFFHGAALKTPATWNIVTGITLKDNVFDSQRRRLPGRGQ